MAMNWTSTWWHVEYTILQRGDPSPRNVCGTSTDKETESYPSVADTLAAAYYHGPNIVVNYSIDNPCYVNWPSIRRTYRTQAIIGVQVSLTSTVCYLFSPHLYGIPQALYLSQMGGTRANGTILCEYSHLTIHITYLLNALTNLLTEMFVKSCPRKNLRPSWLKNFLVLVLLGLYFPFVC